MTSYTLLGSMVPATVDTGDPDSVVLGTAFFSGVDGYASGVRFYKAAANTGTHTGYLWAVGGGLLASVTFTGETASGWQEAAFASPVPLVANARYIVGYHAPNGHYSATGGFFNGAQYDNPPLHGCSNSDLANGCFHYGGDPTEIPSGSFGGGNYFADVIFSESLEPTVTIKSRESGAWAEHTAVPRVRVADAWVAIKPKRWNGTAWIELP